MIHIGDYNKLRILRDTEPGLFLGDDEDQEVLLPNRYVPDTFEIDDVIEVFVYLDNEERLSCGYRSSLHQKRGIRITPL